MISVFKTACRDKANVLSSIPKSKKDVMYLTEKKVCVKEKLYSSMSYSMVGHEFNRNGSTVYIKQDVFKQKHETRLCFDQLMKMSWSVGHRNLTLYFL